MGREFTIRKSDGVRVYEKKEPWGENSPWEKERWGKSSP